jgi:sialate O-acetylesterase
MFTPLLAFASLASAQQAQLPFLSPVFSSHMVLQRDKTNTFWGWTSPGKRVTVSVSGNTGTGTAGSDGKWMVRVAPPPTGGPYTVNIDGPSHVTLDDVLVGDVWVCSGQSNMEFGIGMTNNSAQEIANADHPGIRLFLAPHDINLRPVPVIDGTWKPCNPTTIREGGWEGFSAVGYFFGRELNDRLKVPIGLVETNWGGTVAESWTSKGSLEKLGDFDKALNLVDELGKPGTPDFAHRTDSWFMANDAGSANHWEAPGYNDTYWKETALPTSFRKLKGGDWRGIYWFRRTVTMPQAPEDAVLTLGANRDYTTVWINDVKVGDTYSQYSLAQYHVPAGLLHSGENQIAVRMLAHGGDGGFTQGPETLNIKFGDQTVSLAGNWKYAPGADLSLADPLPRSLDGDPNVPTVLYNGMIYPFVPLAIKGAIWYQGEANVGRAEQYKRLLPAMIADWRQSFGQGDFPFFIVQLANYAERHDQPADDPWPELREAQTYTAEHVRNAGLAVAIDIGDGNDIHPRDKQDVGKRLALAAMHTAYGQNVVYSGPTFAAKQRVGDTLVISFHHTDGGLKGETPLKGFQIAGEDHKFYWADATIKGDTVVISSSNVSEPVDVRYAWDANPEAGLFNGVGLPAVPFRSR